MGRRGGKVRGEQVKAHSEGRTYTKTNGRHTHRVVMENKLGRALRPGEIVHHKDGNKLNNAPGNLELISSQEEHARAHFPQMLAARKAKHGH
ncbi:MAG: HNH endonuclease [Anaerolineae bacterium]|nr:HNH endonuclease [Anaerolineae bacterium]